MTLIVESELRSSAIAETQVFRLSSEWSVTRSSTETGYRVSCTGLATTLPPVSLATANSSKILFAMKSFSYALPAVGDRDTAATTFLQLL